MRQNCTHFVCVLITGLAAMLLSACSFDHIGDHESPKKEVIVGFSTSGTQTKTTMLSNGLTAAWEAGDRLAVWAKGSAGSYVLSNQIFETYGIDDSRGFFTSKLSSEMPQDTYTYYCCYPAPVSVNRTTATFNIPSTQDGKATGGADIMIATPVQHGPLKPLPDPDDHSNMSMTMNRMMHQFRFWVPAEDVKLGDEQIEKIVLTFPTQVVGNVQVDYTDPSKKAVLTSGYSDVTLVLAEPVSKENQKFACVAFVPTKFADGQSLQLKAYTDDKIVRFNPISLNSKDCLPGHSTPVCLIPTAVEDYPYQITFKVATNNLGENPYAIVLEAPQGCVWANHDSNIYRYEPGHEIAAGHEFVFRFEDEAQYRAFSSKTINVTYDSEHALTYQTVTLANLASTDKTTASLTVPYLFFEDFSGIPSFSDGHDNPSVIYVQSWNDFKNLVTNLGSISDTYVGISDLSSYALGGWYGTRVAGQSGASVRICCRYEHVALAGAYYKGRIYSPRLSNIKDDVDAKISVSFKYGSDRKELDPGIFGNPADKSPVMYFGINNQATITNPDEVEGDIIDSITGLISGSGYASSNVSSLSPMAIRAETLPKSGGSYTSFAGTKTVTITGVDNAMRLSWVLSSDNTKSNVHANYWLYLDDIKVQIAK